MIALDITLLSDKTIEPIVIDIGRSTVVARPESGRRGGRSLDYSSESESSFFEMGKTRSSFLTVHR